jgi:hypothetical protein
VGQIEWGFQARVEAFHAAWTGRSDSAAAAPELSIILLSPLSSRHRVLIPVSSKGPLGLFGR